MFSEFRGGVEVSLAERRASAAAPIFYERDFESERFQNFHRSDADVRFVVAHKGVVPKDDMAAGRDAAPRRPVGAERRPYHVLFKPFVEALVGVMGQRTLCRDPKRFLHCDAHGFESRSRFVKLGMTQPILPNKSTLLKIRSRNGRPSRRQRA